MKYGPEEAIKRKADPELQEFIDQIAAAQAQPQA
jgi:hypothetical protein